MRSPTASRLRDIAHRLRNATTIRSAQGCAPELLALARELDEDFDGKENAPIDGAINLRPYRFEKDVTP